MTAAGTAPLVCPSCRSTSTMVGVQGNGLCFACSHTWDPKEVTALPLDTPAPAAPVIDEVAVSTVAAALDVPDPYAFPSTWEGLTEYRAAGGVMADETWWEVRMGAPADQVDPVPSMLDGAPDVGAVTVMLAELIVKAGIAALNGQGDDVTPGVPPTGYLPDDPAMHPMIEQAAAIAVGILITNMHLDVDEILATLGGVTYEETEGDQTTEVSDDTGTGNDNEQRPGDESDD